MSFRFRSLVCRAFLFMCLPFLFSAAKADQREPPLKCEINRGAWCIVKGVDNINFSIVKDERLNRWSIWDSYWQKEVGIVLESFGCVDASADSIEVFKVNSNVLWEGRLWREVVVKLRNDNSCNLRLFVSMEDSNFRNKAATGLGGAIAICISGRTCTENILATYVYELLASDRKPEKPHKTPISKKQ